MLKPLTQEGTNGGEFKEHVSFGLTKLKLLMSYPNCSIK